MTDFNETDCINPNQAILDLANVVIANSQSINEKLCSVEEQSIIRDNALVGGIDELVLAVAAIQTAVDASPADLEALRLLIVENQAALDGLAAQAALNRSIADANTALTASNQALLSQLNQAQSDAAVARQATADAVSSLTSRVAANEANHTSVEARVTVLEGLPVGSGDGITVEQLNTAVCDVYTNIANSMSAAVTAIQASSLASCAHGQVFVAPDVSSIAVGLVGPTPTVPDTDTGGIG